MADGHVLSVLKDVDGQDTAIAHHTRMQVLKQHM